MCGRCLKSGWRSWHPHESQRILGHLGNCSICMTATDMLQALCQSSRSNHAFVALCAKGLPVSREEEIVGKVIPALLPVNYASEHW